MTESATPLCGGGHDPSVSYHCGSCKQIEDLFKTAERLLPKYGNVAMFALNQATLRIEEFGEVYSMKLAQEFEAWLDKKGVRHV